MTIATPEKLADFLTAPDGDALRLLAHPGDQSCQRVFDDVTPSGATPERISLVIGPEGGFTAAEFDLAVAHRCHAVSLGPPHPARRNRRPGPGCRRHGPLRTNVTD